MSGVQIFLGSARNEVAFTAVSEPQSVDAALRYVPNRFFVIQVEAAAPGDQARQDG